MPVLFLIAVLAILAGVFVAATGRGGELAIEHADHAPLDLGPVSAADVALLHPPTALWGYNMQVTDEALDHIARAIRDRDVTIARLRQQIANLDPGALADRQVATRPDARWAPAVPAGAHPLADPGDAAAAQALEDPGDAGETQILSFLKPPGILVVSRAPETATQPREAITQPREAAQPPEATQPSEATTQPREAAQPPEATQPSEAAEPPEATHPAEAATWPREVPQPAEAEATTVLREIPQPSAAVPVSRDVQGPQGSYDTYDWWAEQEAAAREETGRRSDAQQADASAASAPTVSAPAVSQHVEEPAGQADEAPGRTATQPNPALASPEDQALSAAEEQAW